MLPQSLLIFLLYSCLPAHASGLTAATDLASLYGMATSTSIPFPTQTLSSSDAQQLMVSQWSLSKGKVQNGGADDAFVTDPFPNSQPPGVTTSSGNDSTILQVTYPEGSFSHDTGGTQLYSLWNSTSPFQSMILSYELAFDPNYAFVQGGKLPGIRGGPDPNGCSGGSQPNGSDCFSVRLMWRKNGAGEVYSYL